MVEATLRIEEVPLTPNSFCIGAMGADDLLFCALPHAGGGSRRIPLEVGAA